MMSESMSSAVTVRPLPWDSNFFGFDVARMDIAGHVDRSVVRKAVEDFKGGLIYAFSREPVSPVTLAALESVGGVSYGSRVVYHRNANYCMQALNRRILRITNATPQLVTLALKSGVCSRFNRDRKLTDKFGELYEKWLLKDLAKGAVFAFCDGENPVGMVTMSKRERTAAIGLLAVAETMRDQGIASALLNAVGTWCNEEKLSECEVVTQGDNLPARKLYEKNGFAITSQTAVWHIWKTKEEDREHTVQ